MPNGVKSVWSKALYVILVVAILAVLGGLGYAVAMPVVEKLTEFYILGAEGEAADYPMSLMVGERGEVIVGIVNREHEMMDYRIEVRIDGVKNSEVGPIVLEQAERWEEAVTFIPGKVGNSQKVEFLLYKQGKSDASQSVYLWLDVTELE